MAAQPDIGTPLNRIDGISKVTGQARYAGEYAAAGLLYGVVVGATIARGRVTAIDVSSALAVPGVIEIITHKNRPHIPAFDSTPERDVSPRTPPLRMLFDDTVHFSGQPIALVVADTFEAAREAAMRVTPHYAPHAHNTDLEIALPEKFTPGQRTQANRRRGDPEKALAQAAARIDGRYRLAMEHHNPMETHAATVIWEGGGKITVYDKNQGSQNVRDLLAGAFGFVPEKVRVINSYVGGAFGSGLRPSYPAFLAVLAAQMFKRSVRVTLTRQHMFTHVHRPECIENISLACDRSGKLTAIVTHATTASSRFEDYSENIVSWGAALYACDNIDLHYTIAPIDTPTPGSMRAPGAGTAVNLFEIAMDELAYANTMDPLTLRLVNYSDKNGLNGQTYTSKALKTAYQQGAARFGWENRSSLPRSMKQGKELIGWGMATGIWEALLMKATAKATLNRKGKLQIASAASDIGTGTYTIMAQIAAGVLGLPIDRVEIKLGDSSLPASPLAGGSAMAASVGSAVLQACQALAEELFQAAVAMKPNPFGAARRDQVEFADGRLRLADNPACSMPYQDIVAASGKPFISCEATVDAIARDQAKKARNTHSAVFAEVRVDEQLSVVRVTRIVVAIAAGRIINPKTARSQIVGGVVMGIGMALHEEAVYDHRLGRIMNHSLAEYHVPAQADVQDIDVIFVEENDNEINPLGVKGVGEIGIVGTAAAIANAIFHATGKRVRDLPITIDKLLT